MRRTLAIYVTSLGSYLSNTITVARNYSVLLTARNLPDDEIKKRLREVYIIMTPGADTLVARWPI
jgi:hypothetical protein